MPPTGTTEKELVIKVVAMPSDMNPGGDMFGGWIVRQMNLAESSKCIQRLALPRSH